MTEKDESVSFTTSYSFDPAVHKSALSNSPKEQLNLIHRIQESLTKKFQVYSGKDTDDLHYESIEEMWQKEGFLQSHPDTETVSEKKISSTSLDPQWYNKSHGYWHTSTNVPATIDGMLGGFATLSTRDLEASHIYFYKKL